MNMTKSIDQTKGIDRKIQAEKWLLPNELAISNPTVIKYLHFTRSLFMDYVFDRVPVKNAGYVQLIRGSYEVMSKGYPKYAAIIGSYLSHLQQGTLMPAEHLKSSQVKRDKEAKEAIKERDLRVHALENEKIQAEKIKAEKAINDLKAQLKEAEQSAKSIAMMESMSAVPIIDGRFPEPQK